MKLNFVFTAACCLPLSLFAQKGFTIHGKVGTLDAPAKAILVYHKDGKLAEDSTGLHHGAFVFKGVVEEPGNCTIYLKHDTITRSRFTREDEVDFSLENSDITVTATDSIQDAVVKGSLSNEEERQLRALQHPYRRSADSLVAVYQKLTPEERKDSVWRKSARAVQEVTQKGYDSVTRAFIYSHPKSYIALSAFRSTELAYNFNPDTAGAKFTFFPAALRESPTGKKIQDMIDKSRKTNIGRVAMDFTQSDSTGKPVKLSDFRGQYVLLDFWASWCKPCRAENPNYLKAYNKYKDHNFTILGVSLDDEKTKKAWLYAVKMDSLPWTQISDLKGFSSPAAVMYGVEAIPSNYLIDPDGKIIGRNLRGEELEKKLGQLFKM